MLIRIFIFSMLVKNITFVTSFQNKIWNVLNGTHACKTEPSDISVCITSREWKINLRMLSYKLTQFFIKLQSTVKTPSYLLKIQGKMIKELSEQFPGAD